MTKNNSAVVEHDSLVKRETGALATVPEYLKTQLGNMAGSEDVGRDDVLIPRLAIAQDGMSPQLKRQNEAFIPGLEPGQLFDSVSGEIYGEKATVVPLFFFKNFISFIPQSAGGGVSAMYNNLSDVPPVELAWGPNNTTPACTEFKNRMCLLIREGHQPRPIVVSFKSSGLKAAKKWNSLIMDTKLPAFARAYELEVKLKTKGTTQSWYVLDVSPREFVPEEFFTQAQRYFDQLRSDGYKVDTTGIESERRQDNDGAAF